MTKPPVHKVTEADFQDQVIAILELHGWEWRHVSATAPTRDGTFRPDNDARDLPDLICWHPDGGFVGLELKTGNYKVTAGQRALLLAWRASGLPTWVVYDVELHLVPDLLRQAREHAAKVGPFRPT